MVDLGYHLSSEEHAPKELVRYAQQAEASGFSFAIISDHYLPWLERQGHSPFVWSVLGSIAQATQHLRLGTGVTCPTIRYHPTIIAQAAATTALLSDSRFFLGVGSGERLNEHVTGADWPSAETRRAMLTEAIGIIKLLWSGEPVNYDGVYFTVDQARIFDLPVPPPRIMVAASSAKTAELAGELGDGLIGVAPDPNLVHTFNHDGGAGKPRYGKLTVCWAPTEEEARRTAFEQWRNAGVRGVSSSRLATPSDFEQASQRATEADVTRTVLASPDPERHLSRIREYIDAGYDHVYVHQIGPDQQGFFDFYQREVMPRLDQITLRSTMVASQQAVAQPEDLPG